MKEELNMNFVVIGIAYILSIYLFFILIKTRKNGKKQTPNMVYVLIVCILVLLIVWNIRRWI